MKENVTIRLATVSDIDACTRLLEVLFSLETDFEFYEARQKKGLALMLQSPETRAVFVAEVQGHVVGMCSGQILISTAEGGPAMLFEDFIVEESYRGKKIGKLLLEHAEAWAGERGVSRLQLLADKDNHPAIALYERQGWTRNHLISMFKKRVIRNQ